MLTNYNAKELQISEELPMVMPLGGVGLDLLLAYGRRGLVGNLRHPFGLHIPAGTEHLAAGSRPEAILLQLPARTRGSETKADSDTMRTISSKHEWKRGKDK